MKRSTEPAPPIETWTKADVHRWLMTEVKVHETCANRFSEEEVSGDSLVDFEKTDILDLGIKHGPAVKITSYLESLKEGLPHESQFPAYVENWTKEQVNQWLLQHVNIYSKYAERLQEEDVSGDCLVCFKKQDLLDLDVKSGPAVKILAELRKLNKKPEPTLQPILHTKTDQKEAPKTIQPEQSLAQAIATIQPESYNKTKSKTDRSVENETQPFKKASEKQPKPENLEARRKETRPTTVLPDTPKSTVEIQETLENLSKDDLKKFQFNLKEYRTSKYKPISRSRVEGRDTMDTAQLMTDHYGSKDALRVTTDILMGIQQNELAGQLKKNMGQEEQQNLSKGVLKKEANQGDKLKNLLTCGGNSLDNYDRFVVVMNKSSPEQVQYLQFLNKLKLFCVLDFDPNSSSPGECVIPTESQGWPIYIPHHSIKDRLTL
ncbi:uncharacterized protein LOC127349755 [Dicentrarchus labrax]|uniref:uncharacterized protein LOC127349755 n=1 Tax=Dicentrarchus labrax TaxID=13489 RepID=UPI0021F674F6|nr:uncharacterized protein LOC127349755 [Dicentrarchus labrax]